MTKKVPVKSTTSRWRLTRKVIVDAAMLADLRGQMAAINESLAVVEFDLDGTILTANENFLNVIGYALDEVKGRHHSMFVAGDYRASEEYRQFWEKLRRGEFDAGQYRRVGKGTGGLDPGQLQPDPGCRWQGVQGRQVCH